MCSQDSHKQTTTTIRNSPNTHKNNHLFNSMQALCFQSAALYGNVQCWIITIKEVIRATISNWIYLIEIDTTLNGLALWIKVSCWPATPWQNISRVIQFPMIKYMESIQWFLKSMKTSTGTWVTPVSVRSYSRMLTRSKI